MTKKLIVIGMTLLIVMSANTQNLPGKAEILYKMELANDYFMNKWPDPGVDIVTDKTRPSNLWTRATYYEGLMGLYRTNPVAKYYNYAVDWSESHSWLPTYGSLLTRDGDHQCCGQTYIELYEIDNQPKRINSIKACMDNMVDDNDNDDWSWIDAIQMSMPVFAKLGKVYGDNAYYKKMNDMYMYTKNQHGTNGLYNTTEHLWYRDKDFDPPYSTPNGKSCYWSRGNGWVLAALVRVMDVLPDTSKYYSEYETIFKEMSAALLPLQRKDGFWNVSLMDSLDYGGPETSGTAFFVYGMAWGVNKGILEGDEYKMSIEKGWSAIADSALHDNGFLGYVQGTGKQPSDGQPVSYNSVPNFEDYGLGSFLLAGSEVYKMAPEFGTAIDENTISNVRLYSKNGNSSLLIDIVSDKKQECSILIYNIRGSLVDNITDNAMLEKGQNQFKWQSDNVQSGIYIVKISLGNEMITKKIVVK